MKKIDLGQWISALANLGVIAGIVFLAIEIGQNTAAISGSTYQAMSDAAVAQMQELALSSELSGALIKTFQGAVESDLTEQENAQLVFFYYSVMLRMENTYNQYAGGLVDDRVFNSYGWNFTLFNTMRFREYWFQFGARTSTSPEFNAFFEDHFQLQPVQLRE